MAQRAWNSLTAQSVRSPEERASEMAWQADTLAGQSWRPGLNHRWRKSILQSHLLTSIFLPWHVCSTTMPPTSHTIIIFFFKVHWETQKLAGSQKVPGSLQVSLGLTNPVPRGRKAPLSSRLPPHSPLPPPPPKPPLHPTASFSASIYLPLGIWVSPKIRTPSGYPCWLPSVHLITTTFELSLVEFCLNTSPQVFLTSAEKAGYLCLRLETSTLLLSWTFRRDGGPGRHPPMRWPIGKLMEFIHLDTFPRGSDVGRRKNFFRVNQTKIP